MSIPTCICDKSEVIKNTACGKEFLYCRGCKREVPEGGWPTLEFRSKEYAITATGALTRIYGGVTAPPPPSVGRYGGVCPSVPNGNPNYHCHFQDPNDQDVCTHCGYAWMASSPHTTKPGCGLCSWCCNGMSYKCTGIYPTPPGVCCAAPKRGDYVMNGQRFMGCVNCGWAKLKPQTA